jgi:hypothetical protein
MAFGYLLPTCFSWDSLAQTSHCSVFGFLSSTTLPFVQVVGAKGKSRTRDDGAADVVERCRVDISLR